MARIRAVFRSHVSPKNVVVLNFQCWLQINYKSREMIVDIVTSVCFTNLLDFSQIFMYSFDMKWPTQNVAELGILFVQLAWV